MIPRPNSIRANPIALLFQVADIISSNKQGEVFSSIAAAIPSLERSMIATLFPIGVKSLTQGILYA